VPGQVSEDELQQRLPARLHHAEVAVQRQGKGDPTRCSGVKPRERFRLVQKGRAAADIMNFALFGFAGGDNRGIGGRI